MTKQTFTRSQGASSGAESIVYAGLLVVFLTKSVQLLWTCSWITAFLTISSLSVSIQISAMARSFWVDAEVVEVIQPKNFSIRVSRIHRTFGSLKIHLQMLHKMGISQHPTPVVMRNGMVGFCECVRPGGSPNKEHCLELYNLPGYVTSSMFLTLAVVVFAYGPVVSFVRLFYSEHSNGCTGYGRGGERYSSNKSNCTNLQKQDKWENEPATLSELCRSYWELYKFFLRWPVAIQGEGPSNGDGLAQFNGLESLCFPVKLDPESALLNNFTLQEGKISSISTHGINDLNTGFSDTRNGISGAEYRRLVMQAHGVFEGDGNGKSKQLVAYWMNHLRSNSTKQNLATRDIEFSDDFDQDIFTDSRNRPHLRDMFHDKVFCHAFFEAHGAPHPTLIAEVVKGNHVRQQFIFSNGKEELQDVFTEKPGSKEKNTVLALHHRKEASLLLPNGNGQTQFDTLIWKPRYSTMGLGVEKFVALPNAKEVNYFDPQTWCSPSVEHPYVLEEKLLSTEYEAGSEWYRCTTLWSWDEESAQASMNFGGIVNSDRKTKKTRPRSGYIWRTRNEPGDDRIQTDIIGGAYCVVSYDTEFEEAHDDGAMIPFVGHKTPGTVYDPRTKKEELLDPQTDKALKKALKLMVKMHRSLGRNLWSVGWDVMVRGDEALFIEFNINNGFFVADHTIAELYQMTNFYAVEMDARLKAGY